MKRITLLETPKLHDLGQHDCTILESLMSSVKMVVEFSDLGYKEFCIYEYDISALSNMTSVQLLMDHRSRPFLLRANDPISWTLMTSHNV